MPKIKFQDADYDLEDGETILDCLLRHDHDIPFSCKSGVCQSCLMRATSKLSDPESQAGLKAAFKQQNYFLSCQCKPQKDICVALPGINETTIMGVVKETASLCHNVKALLLETEVPFQCIPGQYLSLINSDGVIRSYSVANKPEKDGHIELHVRLIPNGKMSGWVHNQASVGQKIQIRGPAGTCCYLGEEQKNSPMILAGTGTGLAPLYGVLLDAIGQSHQGPVTLIHGALKADDLYYIEKLKELESTNSFFTYIPCILNDDGSNKFTVGSIEDVLLENITSLEKMHVYLCGAPEFVNPAKKKIFLKGISSNNIHCDAFILTNSND